MADQTVALTILAQLGGNRFRVMTGANLMTSTEKSLGFRIPAAKNRINYVRITLDGNDLYKVEFLAIRSGSVKTVSTVEGVGVENLRDVFTEATGLHTSLGTLGR